MIYYLKGLSITPGLCITKMHTATTSPEKGKNKGEKQVFIEKLSIL
jgi:hypothetical protein